VEAPAEEGAREPEVGEGARGGREEESAGGAPPPAQAVAPEDDVGVAGGEPGVGPVLEDDDVGVSEEGIAELLAAVDVGDVELLVEMEPGPQDPGEGSPALSGEDKPRSGPPGVLRGEA
jgi:hypothetical protein